MVHGSSWFCEQVAAKKTNLEVRMGRHLRSKTTSMATIFSMVRSPNRKTLIPNEKILQPRRSALQTDRKRHQLQQVTKQKQIDAEKRCNAGLLRRLHLLIPRTNCLKHKSMKTVLHLDFIFLIDNYNCGIILYSLNMKDNTSVNLAAINILKGLAYSQL